MNCSLKEESLFSKLVRARWRVEETASFVERFERFANWSGSESFILSDQDGGAFGRSGYIAKSSDNTRKHIYDHQSLLEISSVFKHQLSPVTTEKLQ